MNVTARRLVLVSIGSATVITIGVIAFVLSRRATSQPATTVNETVHSPTSDLRSFKKFPVFWLGDNYDGYKLDLVIKPRPDDDSQPAVVTYGSCGPAFESGCAPPIVIKTIPRCWSGLGVPEDSLQLRGRAVSESPNLAIETGSGAVVIYAEKSIAMAIARDLTVANTNAFPEYAQIKQADPLPGSLCELARLHPRVNSTPIPLDPSTPDPHAATVFGAINAISSGGLVSTYGEARAKLGWTPLRNDDPRFTIVENGAIGVLRTLKNPLPTFEQDYEMTDRGAGIMFRQEPESYPDFERQQTTHEHIGAWDVELFTDSGYAGAMFYSGTTTHGERIRVVCFASRSDGYTLDDIREFVRTLGTG